MIHCSHSVVTLPVFILHNVLCTALYMYSLISFCDDELRQARKLRFILFNMDYKWLALLSFVVHDLAPRVEKGQRPLVYSL